MTWSWYLIFRWRNGGVEPLPECREVIDSWPSTSYSTNTSSLWIRNSVLWFHVDFSLEDLLTHLRVRLFRTCWRCHRVAQGQGKCFVWLTSPLPKVDGPCLRVMELYLSIWSNLESCGRSASMKDFPDQAGLWLWLVCVCGGVSGNWDGRTHLLWVVLLLEQGILDCTSIEKVFQALLCMYQLIVLL